jgi:2-polyprenyl-3-methyl-5-hydroxy-6-metoxy-1,4-benzoquinol methylase
MHVSSDYFYHPYFEARRDLSRGSLLAKHRRLLNTIADGKSVKGASLLDIGCDTGSLLAVARDEFGMDVLGIELSEKAAKVARETYGLKVLVGDIGKLNLNAASFDVITLVDVIEHVADPLILLKEVCRLLKRGGKVFLATSDHDALINGVGRAIYRVFGKWSRSLLEKLYVPYHEYYFTKSTLAKLVDQSDLQILYQHEREFPMDEFGHGVLLRLSLRPIFAIQRLTGRQTLQELIAFKP